ncbi:hypothetical protein [Streptomyces sp. NPDC017230]|uniref:hypothetical protein n=1 Tax=unclassified Streptomyces TaxID=2593676 RepID=UPI00378AE2B3
MPRRPMAWMAVRAVTALNGDGGRAMDGLIISPWALEAQEVATTARPLPVVLLGERSPQGLADRIYSPENEVSALDLTIPHRLVVRGSTGPEAQSY